MMKLGNEGKKNFEEMEKDKYHTITDGLYVLQGSLARIADALEEILRLVKKDMEPRTKKKDDS